MIRGLWTAAAVAATAALGVAPAALAGGPSMKVGAVEDAAKWGAPQAKMDLAKNAGFDTVRMTAQWKSGLTAPSATDLSQLRAAASAARADGIEPVVAIYNAGSSSTPADDASRAQFVQFAVAVVTNLPGVTRFIVGNEPNSNLYWMPQFNSDGSNAAAAAYDALLAASYDAIKSARADAVVIGGALDPRGGDDPAASKQTHSPTSFVRDLGAAYRASGRTAPLMDVFDMHVYADNSSLPPSMEHPNTTTISLADYPKLVALLGQAFDGTAQAGSSLPILYGEFGVETVIPSAKAGLYTGAEPATTKPVDEATQASYYAEAYKVAYCQPNVIGILTFHVSDETSLPAWQSGPYYADDTAKSSLPAIRAAANAVRAGSITSCPDATPPSVSLTAPANGAIVGPAGVTVSGTATDDVGVGKVEFLANGVVIGTKYAGPYTFTWTPKTSGTYTITVRAQDAVRNVATSGSVTVTVDLTPPETTISAAPGSAQSGTIAFASSEPGSTFRCSLDGAPSAACASPAAYSNLTVGSHTFTVAAVDAIGNVDPTPASVTWSVVDSTPPETTITAGPADSTTAKDATFSFSASETATFECSLDGVAVAACTSPAAYSALADGTHTFSVRATDAAGNVDQTPATRTWKIASSPPNDMFAAAQPISGWSGRVTGTTLLATKEQGEPRHANNAGGHSVWYVWTVPGNGYVTFDLAGSSFDTLLAIYRGSSVTNLASSAYNDNASGSVRTSLIRVKVWAGDVLRIAVDGANGAAGSVVISWRKS